VLMNKNIWVICDGMIFDSKHILQLLNKANILAKQINVDVFVISIGKYDEYTLKRLFQFGATNVLFCENDNCDEAIHSNILGNMIQEKKPGLLIFPATQFSKVVAATLSSRFEAGLTADCIDIELDTEGIFIFSRAALNNSVIARIKCANFKIQMCTVKENVFPLLECTTEKNVCIEKFNYSIGEIFEFPKIDILKKSLIQKENTVSLNLAKVVFAVGRGVNNGETIKLIRKVAKKYKAEIIGTRGAVEEGLVERSRQVGQSGISICPNVYIGFGISGASQHMVGIKNSKIIIAINSDENAPIFNYADYSVLDDVKSVLKELDSLIS